MTTALMTTKDMADLEAFEAEIIAGFTEATACCIRGVQAIVATGRPLFENHRRKLYLARCSSWDDYCEERFGVSGRRCRQIADAYEVGRTLSASAGIDGTKDPTLMLEYLASIGFSDLIARSLKHVPAEQQPAVFGQAKALADGGNVTATMVDTAAAQATTMPLEWAQMTKEEQLQAVTEAEGRVGPEWDRQRCLDWVRLVLKRNRSPLELAGELPLSDAEKSIAVRQKEIVELCEAALAG